MCCYLFYYTGRQTFGFAIPGIEEELGVSKETLGWVSAAMLWSYAIGQSINGNLGDKFGGRRMMSLGAVLSSCLNWLVSFASSLQGLSVTWATNGFVQSMGWAPGSRVISNWWPQHQRGRAYGCYVFAAGLSSVLTFALSTIILECGLNWRWIFRLPVLLLLGAGMMYFLVARDRPEDLGFAADDPPRKKNQDTEARPKMTTSWDRYLAALKNGPFLIASVAIGCQNLARYGLIIWVPVHFLGDDWKTSSTKWISIALPIGMALGAIASGWISDRFYSANRSRVIVLFMASAAISSVAMWLLPRDSVLAIPLLFFTGFFAYGPQSAFWALCPDLLGRHRAGTGTGVMNTSAYIFAGLGEPLIGKTIDLTGDTSVVFAIVAVACAIGASIAVFIRR